MREIITEILPSASLNPQKKKTTRKTYPDKATNTVLPTYHGYLDDSPTTRDLAPSLVGGKPSLILSMAAVPRRQEKEGVSCTPYSVFTGSKERKTNYQGLVLSPSGRYRTRERQKKHKIPRRVPR